jgi:Zn-dependent protease/predicted transcriptional regulator
MPCAKLATALRGRTDGKRGSAQQTRCVPGRSVKIGRIAGIPVGISPWWLLVVALFTWSLGSSYFPNEVKGITPAASYGLGLASVLLLFASILAHEFGHALVARRGGVEVEEIDLWLLGGVSRMRGQPKTATDELLYAAAGPAVTAVIALVFWLAWLLLPNSIPRAVHALIVYQAEVNTAILAFNLIPAFPLDGGRILRAALWRRTGDRSRATQIAAQIGRGFGYLMIAFGIVLAFEGAPGGLWIAFIGVFVIAGAAAEQQQEQIMAAFTGLEAQNLMSRPAVSIDARAGLDEARELFARYHYTAFPVTGDDGRAIGMLSIKQLQRAPPVRRPVVSVGQLADRDPALAIGEHEDVAHLLEEPAFGRVGRAAVVDRSGRPVGVLSITDVEREVRARHLVDGNGRRDGIT